MKICCLFLFAVTATAQPLVIAHRGASGYVPEHTLEAKAMAHAMGADYLEQDVVLSKDDVPVVLHDIHVDAVSDATTRFPERKRADGRFYALDFTLAELKQLCLHERVDHKTGKQAYPGRFPMNRGNFQIVTLDEELEFIAGLNRSTGRVAGIYPEIKQPEWHRKEGRDISRIVLKVLAKHGYATKADACYLQCFEYDEVKRLRGELGWQGRLIMLMSGGKSGVGGSDFEFLRSDMGLAELAKIVDGIGPAISSIVSGKTTKDRLVTDLTARAHAHKLEVHPYTLRVDDLPKNVTSSEELMKLLFLDAKVDALFTDFPDVTVRWVREIAR